MMWAEPWTRVREYSELAGEGGATQWLSCSCGSEVLPGGCSLVKCLDAGTMK